MAKHNILHRDLKPENMIFRGEGGVSDSPLVIADYGLATYQQEPDVIFTKCGTPGYVAPEIIFYKDGTPLYGTIVDMFSVGVVLHVLLLN
jgi:serine/threonine protein kinase